MNKRKRLDDLEQAVNSAAQPADLPTEVTFRLLAEGEEAGRDPDGLTVTFKLLGPKPEEVDPDGPEARENAL
jgi:hypothetical protein